MLILFSRLWGLWIRSWWVYNQDVLASFLFCGRKWRCVIHLYIQSLIGNVVPNVQLIHLGEVWACFCATHALTCIHGCAVVCTRSHKHKHTNTVAVPPTCLVIEQTSPPITITGPDLHHKRQEGPNTAAPWSGQKPTGEWDKQAEGKKGQTVP